MYTLSVDKVIVLNNPIELGDARSDSIISS